jgi:hypothetical protein
MPHGTGDRQQPPHPGGYGRCGLVALLCLSSAAAMAQSSPTPGAVPVASPEKGAPHDIPLSQGSNHYVHLIPLAQTSEHYLKFAAPIQPVDAGTQPPTATPPPPAAPGKLLFTEPH